MKQIEQQNCCKDACLDINFYALKYLLSILKYAFCRV